MPFLSLTLFNRRKKDIAPLMVDARWLLTVRQGSPLVRGDELKKLRAAAGNHPIIFILSKAYIEDLIVARQFKGTVSNFMDCLRLSCNLSVKCYDPVMSAAFMKALENKYSKNALADAFFIRSSGCDTMKTLSHTFQKGIVLDASLGKLDKGQLGAARLYLDKTSDSIRLLCDIDDTLLFSKATQAAFKVDTKAGPKLNPYILATLRQLIKDYPERHMTIQLITSRCNRPLAFKLIENELDKNPYSVRSSRNKGLLGNLTAYQNSGKPYHTSRVQQALVTALGELSNHVTIAEPLYSCSVSFASDGKLNYLTGALKYKKANEYQKRSEVVILFDNNMDELENARKHGVQAVRVYDSLAPSPAQWAALVAWALPVNQHSAMPMALTA